MSQQATTPHERHVFKANLEIENPPRHTRRAVVWHENGQGTAMLLVGYCPQELAYYLGLAEELHKTFPDADISKMGCHHVTQSHYVKGFTVAMLSIKGPKRVIEGYDEWSHIDFNY